MHYAQKNKVFEVFIICLFNYAFKEGLFTLYIIKLIWGRQQATISFLVPPFFRMQLLIHHCRRLIQILVLTLIITSLALSLVSTGQTVQRVRASHSMEALSAAWKKAVEGSHHANQRGEDILLDTPCINLIDTFWCKNIKNVSLN